MSFNLSKLILYSFNYMKIRIKFSSIFLKVFNNNDEHKISRYISAYTVEL